MLIYLYVKKYFSLAYSFSACVIFSCGVFPICNDHQFWCE